MKIAFSPTNYRDLAYMNVCVSRETSITNQGTSYYVHLDVVPSKMTFYKIMFAFRASVYVESSGHAESRKEAII